jgi:hypothetical protein
LETSSFIARLHYEVVPALLLESWTPADEPKLSFQTDFSLSFPSLKSRAPKPLDATKRALSEVTQAPTARQQQQAEK